MPLATDIYSGKVFQFIKLKELMVGDSEPEETCSELAGTYFTIGKIKFPMKIPEFKRSGIGLILEFHGIPNGFPNQVKWGPPFL
jgi:hypothetical protein